MYTVNIRICLLFVFLLSFFMVLKECNKSTYAQEEDDFANGYDDEADDRGVENGRSGRGGRNDGPFSNEYDFALDEVDCGEDPPFPDFAFSAQPNKNLVYLRVDEINISSLQECGLFKFASAFGVRIVADYDVPDDRLLYVTSTLAEFLDTREEGRVKNTKLLETLHTGHAMIVLFSDEELMRPLLDIDNRPGELKCFPRAFHMSLINQILPNEKQEEVCPQDYGIKDRTPGLVGDFLVSKGYPYTFFAGAGYSGGGGGRGAASDDDGGVVTSPAASRMKMHFRAAMRNGWINTGASECNTAICLEIAFGSWALSSALNSDKCWCEAAREWRFCTQEKLKFGFPALWDTLSKMFDLNNHKYRPDGIYQSKAVVKDIN